MLTIVYNQHTPYSTRGGGFACTQSNDILHIKAAHVVSNQLLQFLLLIPPPSSFQLCTLTCSLAMQLAVAFVFAAACALLLALSSSVTAQSGFVSIDCGGSNLSYRDAETGLSWTSDSSGFGLENVSRVANVSSPAKYRWLSSMRIFEGTQNKYCYEFDDENYGIVQSLSYLVRVSFWTGDRAPFSIPNKDLHISFQLLINANVWDTINIRLPQKDPLVKEVYVVAVLPSISICVEGHNKTAFVSSLELRPINETFTPVSAFMQAEQNSPKAMFLYSRIDLGSAKDVRYPDDSYDRIWSADTRQGYVVSPAPLFASTARSFQNDEWNGNPPSAVLQTALQLNSSFNLTFHGFSSSYNFLYLVSFAEILHDVTENQRVFNEKVITASGLMYYTDNIDLAMDYDNDESYYNGDLLPVESHGFLTFSFERVATSSLGPLVNAIELLYSSPHPMSLGTYEDDVYALKSVKESLPGFDSWKGDPCLPYSYEWLICDSEKRPRIKTLSLQNRSITAEIPSSIGDLKALVELNLQGNNLSGSIPESIAQLPNLEILDLQNNNLSGTIPQALLDRSIDLRLAGNPSLCKDNNATYCDQQPVKTKINKSKKSYTLIVAILAPACAVVLILLASILIFHVRRKGKNDGAITITHLEVIKYSILAQHFTSHQIRRITNDFKTKLGAGGFGDVFFGTLSSGLNVAVKVSSLRDSTQEGLELLNEVALLSRVHHKNLVEFIGYCIQPSLVLVYEYMAKGSLEDYLHGKDSVPLSWRDRLKIIVGAAQGLEYLHNGCKPPIIHRDVKCSNILLDEELEGKISDFGISRSKLGDTHKTVTTVQGTVGYIAPEYAELRITEKIDVFAFGVVLLEVVSGRRPFEGSQHIAHRVGRLLDQSQIHKIADPCIAAEYNTSSVRKVLEVAMACVDQDAQRRPDMHGVCSELNAALLFELQNDTVTLTHESSDPSVDIENVHTT